MSEREWTPKERAKFEEFGRLVLLNPNFGYVDLVRAKGEGGFLILDGRIDVTAEMADFIERTGDMLDKKEG